MKGVLARAMKIEVLCRGFPGKADVGFLGFSNVALITTERERILFDTGAMGVRLNLLDALEKCSVRPCDVNKVVLSHLHYDHCENAYLFPNAAFFVSEDEWDYAIKGDDLLIPHGIVDFLKGRNLCLVKDGTDIAQGLKVISTPGHTPGGISLVLEIEGGKWVLAGDVVKNRIELATGHVDMTLDPAASEHSIAKIRKLAHRVLPGHDGWLRIDGGRVTVEESPSITVMLPEGMKGGANRYFNLTVEEPIVIGQQDHY